MKPRRWPDPPHAHQDLLAYAQDLEAQTQAAAEAARIDPVALALSDIEAKVSGNGLLGDVHAKQYKLERDVDSLASGLAVQLTDLAEGVQALTRHVAHLAGTPAPAPRPGLLASLWGTEPSFFVGLFGGTAAVAVALILGLAVGWVLS